MRILLASMRVFEPLNAPNAYGGGVKGPQIHSSHSGHQTQPNLATRRMSIRGGGKLSLFNSASHDVTESLGKAACRI